MIRIERLHRDLKGSAARMDELCARIERFSQRLGHSGANLIETMWKGFAERSPAVGIWVAIDVDTGAMLGHTVATMLLWDGAWVGWSHQTDYEGPWATPEQRSEWNQGLDEWAREWNAGCAVAGRPDLLVSKFIMETPHAPKVMARLTGFAFKGTLMERPLEVQHVGIRT